MKKGTQIGPDGNRYPIGHPVLLEAQGKLSVDDDEVVIEAGGPRFHVENKPVDTEALERAEADGSLTAEEVTALEQKFDEEYGVDLESEDQDEEEHLETSAHVITAEEAQDMEEEVATSKKERTTEAADPSEALRILRERGISEERGVDEDQGEDENAEEFEEHGVDEDSLGDIPSI